MNNEDKKIEVMPIGKVTLRDGTEMTMNSRQIENYARNKENRPKGKVSQSKTRKSSVSKGKIAGALLILSMTAVVGHASSVGRQNIINNINNSNFVPQNVYSIESSEGYKFFEIDIDENRSEINGNDYIVELCATGQENGYTTEQMAIYCDFKYGTDYGLSEGKMSEIETTMKSYMQFLNGNEQVEGRLR